MSATTALLLNDTTLVRYLPSTAGEEAVLTFRAWDRTSGPSSTEATPSYRNPGTGGGTSAFSAEIGTVVQYVSSVNTLGITTVGNVALPSGTSGLTGWTAGTVVEIADPNFAVEPGTSSGTFAAVVDFSTMAADSYAGISDLHYVSRDTVVGTTVPYQLLKGDLLVSFHVAETLTSVNTLNATSGSIVVFRPTVLGDYSAGTWTTLLENPLGGQIGGFTLIEKTTTIGQDPGRSRQLPDGRNSFRILQYVAVSGTGDRFHCADADIARRGLDIDLGHVTVGYSGTEAGRFPCNHREPDHRHGLDTVRFEQ
ncbi:MAG: hypothetical protein H6978_01015 [Gammaproteobacteria bacterium]|nr:hypothetical protein [Gammaproteobacteria bacterium]